MSRFFSDRSTGLALSAIALVIVGLALTPTPAPAAFPGTNGKIAFSSERDGDNEVFVMNPDGSEPTNLTNNAVFDDDPAYSPDGSKITFVSVRDGNFEIYVMNADGSAPRRLTNKPRPIPTQRSQRTARRSPSQVIATATTCRCT